jgi:hypothetical protein
VAHRVPAPGRRQAAAQAAPARLGCHAAALPASQGIVLATCHIDPRLGVSLGASFRLDLVVVLLDLGVMARFRRGTRGNCICDVVIVGSSVGFCEL